jgi:hypothetical protein
MIAPGGRAKNFALDMLAEMQADGGTENTE